MGVILNNLIPIIGSSIAMSIPLVLASVGGAFSVRSGIMALGLESMMMMGAFFGVLGSYFTGSVLFGFLLGMVGGMVIGLFHGILSVRYKVNQVISGIGLNLLALAVTTLLMQLIWNNKGSTPQVASISTTLDFFAPIPVIGPILAQQSVSFLVMVAAVVVGWIVLFKTRFGLRLRMVGENPKAAATSRWPSPSWAATIPPRSCPAPCCSASVTRCRSTFRARPSRPRSCRCSPTL